MDPAQQAAWTILQSAFTFVAGELRQRWQLAREAKETPPAANPKPAVSDATRSEAQRKLAEISDAFTLEMMSGNLKTAVNMAKTYNRRWNMYREQLPKAIDPVPIQLQMEEAAKGRDDAITEIKNALQALLEQEIVIESPKA